METIKYVITPNGGGYLHHVLAGLEQSGKSRSEAIKILNQLIAACATVPPLPHNAELEWDRSHGLIVVAANGDVFGAHLFFLPKIIMPIERRESEVKTAPALRLETRGRAKTWSLAAWDIVGNAFHDEESRNSEGGNCGVADRVLAAHAATWKEDGLPFLKEHLIRGKSQLRSNLLAALRRLGYRRAAK